MTLRLMEHQVRGVDFLKSTPRAAILDEPGIGKSCQALMAAVEPVLVVAPAMVLDGGNWTDEVEKWTPGMDVTQVSYSSLTGRERTGNGNGTRPTPYPREKYRGHYGTVILDEGHYCKGRKTKWTQAVRALDSDRTIFLTGTPLPNWAPEAFVPLQLIYPEDAAAGRRLGSYWRWVAEWFQVGPNPHAQMAVGDFRTDRTWGAFREENWGDRYLLRLREDCLDLPPLTITQWLCPMAKEQARVYKALKKDFVAWLDSGEEVVAWNQAAQLVKLCQAATGLDVLDREQRSSGKLDVLRSILRDRPRPTLVVGHFRETVAACARASEEVGRSVMIIDGGTRRGDRLKAVRAFQSGGLDVLCATVGTVSEGLTLHQGGADQVIRVERAWTPSRNEQVIRRLHRIGVERPVSVIDLVTPDTVDFRVLALLAEKSDEQMKAIRPRDLLRLA